MTFNPFEDDEEIAIEAGRLEDNIEEEILEIIRMGVASGEHIGLRPLREVFQNSDDEASDRLYIHIDKDAMTFLNDGNNLTAHYSGGALIGGTCRMIMGLRIASKKVLSGKAGNFGTGLRSAHAISHHIEVHGSADHFTLQGGEPVATGKKAGYDGRSNAYSRDLEEGTQKLRFSVRDEGSRPRRSHLPDDCNERRGVMIRLEWRRRVHPGSVDHEEWEEYLWNQNRIGELVEVYAEEIPRILLGCSWLREVVLDVNLGSKSLRRAWSRDFNHREHEGEQGHSEVHLSHFEGGEADIESGLVCDISELAESKTDAYHLLSIPNHDIAHIAEEALHPSPCHLLIPEESGRMLPAYTPIALTGDSGNVFGPIAFLPPDTSRTTIKIDGVKSNRQHWAAEAVNSISKTLLPYALEFSIDHFADDPLMILRMLPAKRTDKWFTDGRGMSFPKNPHHGLANMLRKSWKDMDDSWLDYIDLVSENAIFSDGEGGLATASEVVNLEVPEEASEAISELCNLIGLTVLEEEQREVLDWLDEDDWDDYHPTKRMTTVSSPLEIKELLSEHENALTVSLLGEDLVGRLIDLFILNPPEDWREDLNTRRVPCIPTGEGSLKSLVAEDRSQNFFAASEHFPDLLPDSRCVHSDFAERLQGELREARATELARLVSEAAQTRPGDFEDLGGNPGLHRQVSAALVAMTNQTDFNLSDVCEFSFIPCLHKGRVAVRRPNHVGNLVWGITSGFPVRNWPNHCHRDFVFGDHPERRTELGLHRLISEQLFWLELHEDHLEESDDVCQQLHVHKAWPVAFGVNLIRSLIFAEDGNGMDKAEPVSLFHKHESGEWEVERWLGRRLKPKELDEVLTSVLGILQRHNGLSGGWGAHPRDHLNSLYLLKDESGEWSKVGELCLELPSDLSDLFGKRKVCKEHQDMLHLDMLTRDEPRDRNSGGGLGITQRISEADILDKIQSLDINDSGVREGILDMMLSSADRWELETLQSLEWVLRSDGEIVDPSKAMLPTDEFVGLFGAKHPRFVVTQADCSSPEVRERANEIGIRTDDSDSDTLLGALLGPDNLWPDFKGREVLKSLAALRDDPDSLRPSSQIQRGRLPDGSGQWSDNSWLVVPGEKDVLSELYGDCNVVSEDDLGSASVAEMALDWILPEGSRGPEFDDLLEKLRVASSHDGPDPNEIRHLWSLIAHRSEDRAEDGSDLLVEIGGELVKVGDIAFYGPESEEFADEESVNHVTLVDEGHELSDLLSESFGALNLESTNPDQVLEIAGQACERGLPHIWLEKLWLAIAAVPYNDTSLLGLECWPYKSADEVGIHTAIHDSDVKEALFPMRDDSEDRINRMIMDPNGGLPMFLLPRQGELMERIYRRIEAGDRGRVVPLIVRNHRRTSHEGEQVSLDDWPYLENAIENIIEAIDRLEIGRIPVDSVSVTRTNAPLGMRLEGTLGPGCRRVYWKDITDAKNVMGSIVEGELRIRVSTSRHNNRSDEELVTEIIGALRPDTGGRSEISEIVRYPENEWHRIDERLSGFDSVHPRPLVEEGVYNDFRNDLHVLYGCCQFCGRQTAADKDGNIQEGVVSLFMQRGRYRSESIPYSLGNSMYLCPNHKASHHRGLFWIEEFDKAVSMIKKGQGDAGEAIGRILGRQGDVILKVTVYERETGEGEMGDVTKDMTWRGEHADRFRDVLTMHLSTLED